MPGYELMRDSATTDPWEYHPTKGTSPRAVSGDADRPRRAGHAGNLESPSVTSESMD